MNREGVNKAVLLLVVFFISAIFIAMIKMFLMAIFLAGLASAMAYPLYRMLNRWFRRRAALASLTTLFIIILFILIPTLILAGIVTNEAVKVGNTVTPFVQKLIAQPDTYLSMMSKLPFYEQVLPYRDIVLTKLGEIVGTISNYLIESLQMATLGTMKFFFSLFVFLYSMFFFLMDGHQVMSKILYYLPLEDHDEQRMLRQFTSVTRATLKGTAIIGLIQGTLAGLAFAVVGIPSSIFWGVIMVVLSVLPGIGSALIWFPAALILGALGDLTSAIGLALFCGILVGSLDNFLRPILVGKDTKMHELLIFLGTLGGITMFGVVGFVVGPIIAALFVTVWDIYGQSFKSVLPLPFTSTPRSFEPSMKREETEKKAKPKQKKQ